MKLELMYTKPATTFNSELLATYEKNIFSVMEEVWDSDDERIDLVLNMPVSRLSGLCRGFYPMGLTCLMIAIANRRGRKRR